MSPLSPPRRASATRPRRFALLAVAVSVAVFLQAVTAGQFVSQDGADSWITVHGVIADVTWVLALVLTAAGWLWVRAAHPRLVWTAAALFILLAVQTGIGHLITDSGHDWLIAIHVPLAFVIWGVTAWLTARSVTLARADQAAGARPVRPTV